MGCGAFSLAQFCVVRLRLRLRLWTGSAVADLSASCTFLRQHRVIRQKLRGQASSHKSTCLVRPVTDAWLFLFYCSCLLLVPDAWIDHLGLFEEASLLVCRAYMSIVVGLSWWRSCASICSAATCADISLQRLFRVAWGEYVAVSRRVAGSRTCWGPESKSPDASQGFLLAI